MVSFADAKRTLGVGDEPSGEGRGDPDARRFDQRRAGVGLDVFDGKGQAPTPGEGTIRTPPMRSPEPSACM